MCAEAAGVVSVRAGGAETQTGRERYLSPADQTAALVSIHKTQVSSSRELSCYE